MPELYIIHTTFSQRDMTYTNVTTENVHYIDVSYDTSYDDRLKIIMNAKQIVENQNENVIIRTTIMTSDYHSPCGCTGYDNVCWNCRYQEEDIRECFCSTKYNTICEYHK